jgi:predicted PurR-regulated permease PerM
MEAIVSEQVILGIFLAIPLLIVAAMFTDELWEEYRQRHPRDAKHEH